MEIVLVLAVLFVILLILGVDIGMLIWGMVWLLEIALVLMVLFFLTTLVLWLAGKPCKGQLSHISEENGFRRAVYLVDGQSYSTLYPAESLFAGRIYTAGEKRLRICRFAGEALVFDRHSLLIAVVGLILSLLGAMLLFLLLNSV